MTLRFPHAVLALAFLASTLCAQTQSQMTADACGANKKADAALNETYKKVLAEYAKDTVFLPKLKAAQRAWIAFRDAQLEALYPAADKQAEYGSMYSSCCCAAMQQLTEYRTKELQKWLDGVPEGETCRGSIKSAASLLRHGDAITQPESARTRSACSDPSS